MEARLATIDSSKFLLLLRNLIGLKNEELLVHSERFVDSWIEETFIWILAALPGAHIFLDSVAMVSICRHEIEGENFFPVFNMKVHES